MDKSSLKWNSLCGVLRHNPYVIQINFGAKFARTRFLPLRAQVGNSLFLPMPPRLLKSAILTPESLIECQTGVFSWCVSSWFILSVKREFRNYTSWRVTQRFCVTRGELELLTDIPDFTMHLFCVIFRATTRNFDEISVRESLLFRIMHWQRATDFLTKTSTKRFVTRINPRENSPLDFRKGYFCNFWLLKRSPSIFG